MGVPLNLSLAVWEGDLCTQTALPKSLDLGRFVSEFRVIAYFNFKGRFGDIPQESHEVSQTAPAPHSLTLTSVGFHTSHFWVGTRSLARFLIGLILSGGKLRTSFPKEALPPVCLWRWPAPPTPPVVFVESALRVSGAQTDAARLGACRWGQAPTVNTGGKHRVAGGFLSRPDQQDLQGAAVRSA